MAAVGIFPMEPTTKSKVSVVPITLTPELLRTLEEMMRMGRGAAVKFDSKGKSGQLIIPGHQPAEFSLSQTKEPLLHILKEAENKVEVFRPSSTSLVVDSWQKGAARQTFETETRGLDEGAGGVIYHCKHTTGSNESQRCHRQKN